MIYIMMGRGNCKSQTLDMLDKLTKADIKLTDNQLQSIVKLGESFVGFSEAMITIMSQQMLTVGNLTRQLEECLTIPEPYYEKKNKPWKKDRFY